MDYTTIRVSTEVKERLYRVQLALADSRQRVPGMDQVVSALLDRWAETGGWHDK